MKKRGMLNIKGAFERKSFLTEEHKKELEKSSYVEAGKELIKLKEEEKEIRQKVHVELRDIFKDLPIVLF